MAYRMRVRRRAPARSRMGRYFKKQNFKRLQRFARQGRFACYRHSIDTLVGASSSIQKAAAIPISIKNGDNQAATSNRTDPGTTVTLRKARFDNHLYFYHASGTRYSSHVRVGVGLWRLSQGGRTPDVPKDRIYFPGKFMQGRTWQNEGFQWLKRAEFANPVTVRAANAGRPDPVIQFTWSLYNVRLKPNHYFGLAFWFIDDDNVEIQRCSLASLGRFEAVSDAPNAGTKGASDDTAGDILVFEGHAAGLTYNLSASGVWNPLRASQ